MCVGPLCFPPTYIGIIIIIIIIITIITIITMVILMICDGPPVKESEIGLCKHQQYEGSDQELRSILLHVFLKTPIPDLGLTEGLELSALTEEDFVTVSAQ